MSGIEWYERKTVAEIIFPAAGRGSDLNDPITRRSLRAEWVRLELVRKETPDEGACEWAHVAVYGPRRLKSGALGKEISSFGWESAYVYGSAPGTGEARPEWLSAALAEQLPEGWSRALVGLPRMGGGA